MPKEIASFLEQRRDEMAELLARWVNIDSPTAEKALVDKLGAAVREKARQFGASVEVFAREKYGDHFLLRWDEAAQGGSAKPVLLLAHIDTVWPAGEAARRPAKVEGDVLRGPGAYDMKSGLIQGLYALHALRELGRRPNRPVMFLVTTDEEIGSPTSRPLIEELARQAEAVFVLEPSTGEHGALKTARKGIAMYKLAVSGRAAHAGVEPEKGVSAVLELAHQVQALHDMNDWDNGVSVTVGKAAGGTLTNVVPAEAEATVDVRALTARDMERLDRAIRGLAPRLDGATLDVSGGINRPPMERTDRIGRLFERARSVAEELGFSVDESTTGGGSDGNFTAALGVPTLDGLGAVGGGAHALAEWVHIPDMPRRASLVARLLELT